MTINDNKEDLRQKSCQLRQWLLLIPMPSSPSSPMKKLAYIEATGETKEANNARTHK
jgi:hypothetical protein